MQIKRQGKEFYNFLYSQFPGANTVHHRHPLRGSTRAGHKAEEVGVTVGKSL